MSFLTPLYLAAAALIALPILLHLLRRDVAPPVPFTAVRLLQKSPVDRSRQHRLRDLLLLAARVAALLLIAASFARPYVAGSPATGSTTVIAVDRSFSMAAPERFARARALARQAVDEYPAQRIAVVAFDERADVMAPPGSAAAARAAIAALEPGFGGTRYAAAFDKVAELVVNDATARVVLVSDLQRSALDDGRAVLPEGIELIVRDAGGAASNLSVTSAVVDGAKRRAVVTVRNYGTVVRAAAVRATIGGQEAVTRVSIPAGGAIDVAFDAPGDLRTLKVAIDDPDGYAADNERFGVAESRALPRVLIVAGGPASANGFYLSRALQAEAEEGADFDVRVVMGAEMAALTAPQVAGHAVIMVLSTRGLDRRAGETLRGFLAGGGGLFVAAGPEVDPSVLSALLEWRPAMTPRDARGAGTFAATDLRHPIFRPFDAVAANFGQVAFSRAWAIDAGSTWRVVARFTDGAPALAERPAAAGKVLLFTSDVDRRWNDFPLHPAFVPFTQEVARYLGARPPALSTYLVADVPAGLAATPGLVQANGRTIAVNVDARESAVDRVAPAAFQQLVTRASAASQPRAERLAREAEGHQNYWRYGLMLLLATLVMEAFVGSR